MRGKLESALRLGHPSSGLLGTQALVLFCKAATGLSTSMLIIGQMVNLAGQFSVSMHKFLPEKLGELECGILCRMPSRLITVCGV